MWYVQQSLFHKGGILSFAGAIVFIRERKLSVADACDSRSIQKVRSVYFQTALILFSPANATDPKRTVCKKVNPQQEIELI